MKKYLWNKRSLSAAAACILSLSLCVASVPAASVQAYQSYIRGLMAGKIGDLQSSVEEYEHVIDIDGTAAAAYKELAYLYWQTGKKDKAYAAAEKLEQLSGTTLSAQLFLGSFYLMAGQADLAVKAWERALEIDPENDMATLYLAAAALNSDPKKALSYWEKYVRREPQSAEGYFQLGLTQEKLGQLEKARQAYQKAVFLNPESLEAHLALAQAYEKQEKLGAAAQEYEQTLKVDPGNISVLMYLGGLYFRLKNYPASESTFRNALEASPGDTTAHFWLGILAEERKDWPEAVRHFEFIRTKEESTLILTRLSYYYTIQREYGKAVDVLKRFTVIDPFNPSSHYLLALTYFESKKYRLSEKSFKRVIELKPDFEEVYFHLGILYDKWGKFDKAVPMFQKTIQLNPKNATALNYLGYSYVDRKVNLDEGERLIREALALDPGNGAYIDSLGWLLYRKGDYPEAEKELTRAGAKIPDPVVYEHLGDARMKLGMTAEAWDAYHQSLDLDSGNSGVKKKLRALEKLVLPNTLQRKVLKRAVGNLIQVATLQATVLISAEMPTANFRSYGIFQYSKPGQWRMDIHGSVLAPRMVLMHDKETRIYPQALEEMLSPLGRQVLATVGEYLNADRLQEFDQETTRTKAKGRYYYYTMDDRSMVIDSDDGTVKHYEVNKKIVLDFKSHTLVEGLYLPAEINVYLPEEKIYARLKLQHPVLNKPLEGKTFQSPE